ncbi:RING-H2 finger protein ATL39-like [Andrographis paniculata]|uniref:RING-H2 finger protein ATL39-like n=1 Tax=Andrographis paniculata TaxID=175694 RepID=UPI0021E70D21|nr:RING-H2 finger protein ATL39-like [Andrographis paniculata]
MEDNSAKSKDDRLSELMGKIMVIGLVTVVFLAIFIVGIRLIVCRLFPRRRRQNTAGAATRRRAETSAVWPHGLNPSRLKTLPVAVVRGGEFDGGDGGVLECAVCLNEISAGETARFLPECRHGFHVPCIDTWLLSNSTCPICRNPISDRDSPAPGVDSRRESAGDGSPEIDIPGQVTADQRREGDDDDDDRTSPFLERLRSINRLFNGGAAAGNASAKHNPSGSDIERGHT